MEILFLDQNKWIELARVDSGADQSSEVTNLYSLLCEAVDHCEVIAPLSLAHIIETSKINDSLRRQKLAKVQTKLSKGWVFRSRKSRLLYELRSALKRAFAETVIEMPGNWFLAEGFMQAFEEFDDQIASPQEVARNKLFNAHVSAEYLLYDFLVSQNDLNRRKAIEAFSRGSDDLVTKIEARRQKLKSFSLDMKGRAYAAQLFIDHQDLIVSVLDSIGRSVDEYKALGPKAVRELIDHVPTLNVEKQLGVKLEAQSRDIHPNDLRDMHSFCAAVPYADWVISENTFVSLANQCRLGSAYGTKITTKLTDLSTLLHVRA